MSIIQAPTGTADTFREHTASLAKDGTRRWIFPKQPAGRFYRARTAVSVLLLAFLFAAPLVKVNGQQFLLFNVIERKFVFFGLVFFPRSFCSRRCWAASGAAGSARRRSFWRCSSARSST
jgi:hypothetical protein